MPKLTCPACSARGEVRGTEEFFEIRGQWPDGNWPVRKCRSCGAGLIVKPRLVPPGVRATIIPAETWTQMENMWRRAFESDDQQRQEGVRPGEPVLDTGPLSRGGDLEQRTPGHRSGGGRDQGTDQAGLRRARYDRFQQRKQIDAEIKPRKRPSEQAEMSAEELLARVKERGFVTSDEVFAAYGDLERLSEARESESDGQSHDQRNNDGTS